MTTLNRRKLLASLAFTAVGTQAPVKALSGQKAGNLNGGGVVPDGGASDKVPVDRVDPWIELIPSAYLGNVAAISERCDGRPVIAVLKNNAYGLGVVEVASILDRSSHLWGFAVVHSEDVFAMLDAGVRKPILLMARHATSEGEALVRAGVTLSAFDDDDPTRLGHLAQRLGRPVPVHIYVDTGLGRMGRFHSRVEPWLEELAPTVRIDGAFTMLTSDDGFVEEQLRRFEGVRKALGQAGFPPGLLHVASSAPLLHHPASRFDAVRPGILLHGSLPGASDEETSLIDVEVAFRLRARVVRLERLPAGTTLGFSRFYPIETPTWIATLPTGWGDGYPSAAENGAVVLARGRPFQVVNVNGNHTNVLVGPEKVLEVDDVVTLMGPDDPAITPAGLAAAVGGHNYRQIDLKSYLPSYIL